MTTQTMTATTTALSPKALTLRAVAVGMTTAPLAFFSLWWTLPEVPLMASASERLHFALQLCAGPSLVAVVILFGCFRLLDTIDAEDPLAGKESHGWKINQRVLQNTVEQSLMFLPAFLALSIRLDPADARALPVLMSLWCVGRLLFWAGYRIAYHFRAIGFDWSLSATTITLGWLGYTLF